MIEYIISLFIFFIIAGTITALSHLSLYRKYKKAMHEMQTNFERHNKEINDSYRKTMQELQSKHGMIFKELESSYNIPVFEDTPPEPPKLNTHHSVDKNNVQTA